MKTLGLAAVILVCCWLLMQGGGSIGAQLGSFGGGGRDPYDRDPNEARSTYRAQSPFFFGQSTPSVADRYHR